MANVKSAIKRARQNDKRRERNNALRSAAKTAAKLALTAISAAKNKDEAAKALISGEKALYKAASKGVVPKERASRKASRLAAAFNKRFASASA